MLQFLESIGDFLINIVSFVVSFFRNVVEVCSLVFKGFGYAVTIIGYIPLEYKVIILAFISFYVIVAIIHFGG